MVDVGLNSTNCFTRFLIGQQPYLEFRSNQTPLTVSELKLVLQNGSQTGIPSLRTYHSNILWAARLLYCCVGIEACSCSLDSAFPR